VAGTLSDHTGLQLLIIWKAVQTIGTTAMYNSDHTFRTIFKFSLIYMSSFVILISLQWNGNGSIVVADVQSYIISGVNLIHYGTFLNAFGEPELWFPPLFPILIGVFSLGGRIDPLLVGRLITLISSCLTLVFVHKIGRYYFRSNTAGIGCSTFLICNALFQQFASICLSQSLATLLSTAGLAFWIDYQKNRKIVFIALFGLATGLGYLTRPEIAILFPLLLIIDWVYNKRRWRRLIIPYVISCTIFSICSFPYIYFLKNHTGKWMISNKSEVNLASGRSTYYGLPREYINEKTLTMEFHKYPITKTSEIERYFFNLREIILSYVEIYRFPIGIPVMSLAFIGLIICIRSNIGLVTWAIIVQFAYLFVAARYAIGAAYLHATLPAIALLSVAGARWFWKNLKETKRTGITIVILSIFAFTGLSIFEQVTREARWSMTQKNQNVILRDAGLAFRQLGLNSGTMLELGGTVSYYSGLYRGRLTENDLETNQRYAEHIYKKPIYIAVSSTQKTKYHPSISNLLYSRNDFPIMIDWHDSHERVLILRLDKNQ